jgi:hypothetical protein
VLNKELQLHGTLLLYSAALCWFTVLQHTVVAPCTIVGCTFVGEDSTLLQCSVLFCVVFIVSFGAQQFGASIEPVCLFLVWARVISGHLLFVSA